MIIKNVAYVATQAITDKLQGSGAAYLRFGGVVNNRIKKGLLLSLKWKSFLNIWQSYKQERGCVMHFARLANTYRKRFQMRFRSFAEIGEIESNMALARSLYDR